MATKKGLSGVTIRPRLALSLTLLAVLCCLLGCNTNDPSAPSRRLRLSMIPNTDPGKILRENQLLIAYLEQATGARVELSVPTNYAAVVEALANDQVDIAFLGGFTYLQAQRRAGVRPLVQRERDQNFHSLFITQPDSGINSLADLKGHSFAFGDVNSTSGHLMPEYYMRAAQVDPEVIARAVYTGGHDATALAVANKRVAAGAMDEVVYQRMTQEGKLDPARVRVFYTTPPFFDYLWAARRGLDAPLAEAFANALLKLNASNPAEKNLLELLSATKYVKAEDANYEKLRQAAKEAGLLK